MDFDAALGNLRLPIQTLRLQGHFNRFVLRLTVLRHHRRFERRVAYSYGPHGRPSLTRAVGHIGIDLEHECRLVLFRDGEIRPGCKFDLKCTIYSGLGGSVRDFLTLALAEPAPM